MQLLDAIDRDGSAALQQFAAGALARATPSGETAGFTLSPGQVRYGPGGEQIAAGPPREVPPRRPRHVGSFEDYVVRRFGPTPTPEQITQARKDYQQADDRPITSQRRRATADHADRRGGPHLAAE